VSQLLQNLIYGYLNTNMGCGSYYHKIALFSSLSERPGLGAWERRNYLQSNMVGAVKCNVYIPTTFGFHIMAMPNILFSLR